MKLSNGVAANVENYGVDGKHNLNTQTIKEDKLLNVQKRITISKNENSIIETALLNDKTINKAVDLNLNKNKKDPTLITNIKQSDEKDTIEIEDKAVCKNIVESKKSKLEDLDKTKENDKATNECSQISENENLNDSLIDFFSSEFDDFNEHSQEIISNLK